MEHIILTSYIIKIYKHLISEIGIGRRFVWRRIQIDKNLIWPEFGCKGLWIVKQENPN